MDFSRPFEAAAIEGVIRRRICGEWTEGSLRDERAKPRPSGLWREALERWGEIGPKAAPGFRLFQAV